jgi:hypothetical protein
MRIRWVLLAGTAAAASLVAATGTGADDSNSKDELAQGEWEGDGEWKTLDVHVGGGGGGASAPEVPGTPDPGTSTGGEDGAGEDDPEDDGGESEGTPTPSCPMGPEEDPPPVPGDEDGDSDEDGSTPAPPDEPEGPETGPAPGGPSCSGKWRWEIDQPDPELYDSSTALTLTIFRTDSWAFVCNAYCRSESTWYVDWFVSTAASHSGRKQIKFRIALEGGCDHCTPEIRFVGSSQLEARAQVKTSWGEVEAGTTADAQAAAVWAGPLDCSDDCSAQARPEAASSKWGVGAFGMESENTVSTGFSYASAMGGKGASMTVHQKEAEQFVTDRASVSTNAGGTECNAQAKARAGYDLEIHARTGHGDLADLVVELEEK